MLNSNYLSLSLFFHFKPAKRFLFQTLTSTETTLAIKTNLIEKDNGLYIKLQHDKLNTQLNLDGIGPAVVLQFDKYQQFTGASLSLGTGAGPFGLITQSKRLLIMSFDKDFPIEQLSHFEHNQ
jgi:hypothetical protein